MGRSAWLFGVPAFCLLTSSLAAYEIEYFGPEAFNEDTSAMDTTLGVTGFVIESFEDPFLVGGLEIQATGGNIVSLSSLDNLSWDGERVAILSGSVGQSFTFHILGGATSFGIGITALDLPNTITVNDSGSISLDVSPFMLNGAGRNGYVRIDSEPGDPPITSVTVTIDSPLPGGDAFRIDHVAFAPDSFLGTLIIGLLANPPTVNGWEINLVPDEHMTGPNVSANEGRLDAFISRLISAQELVGTDPEGACEELASAMKKLTGENSWFNGDVAAELISAVLLIQNVYACPP